MVAEGGCRTGEAAFNGQAFGENKPNCVGWGTDGDNIQTPCSLQVCMVGEYFGKQGFIQRLIPLTLNPTNDQDVSCACLVLVIYLGSRVILIKTSLRSLLSPWPSLFK